MFILNINVGVNDLKYTQTENPEVTILFPKSNNRQLKGNYSGFPDIAAPYGFLNPIVRSAFI